MKKIRIFIFVLVILLTFGLGACTRSASQPSTLPEKEGDASNLESGTLEPMGVLEAMATQTAAAQEAIGKEAEVEPGEAEVLEGETAVEDVTTDVEDEEAEFNTDEESSQEVGADEEEFVYDPDNYEVPDVYTVQKGDFLYCIARRFDIDVVALLSVNGLSIDSNVYAGTKLTIPKNAAGFIGDRALRDHPTKYTILSGDTINSIACYFGDVDPRAIEDANGLSGDYALKPGKVLYIP